VAVQAGQLQVRSLRTLVLLAKCGVSAGLCGAIRSPSAGRGMCRCPRTVARLMCLPGGEKGPAGDGVAEWVEGRNVGHRHHSFTVRPPELESAGEGSGAWRDVEGFGWGRFAGSCCWRRKENAGFGLGVWAGIAGTALVAGDGNCC